MSQDRAVWGCRGLGVRYGGAVALEDVTLEVPAGSVAAVIGLLGRDRPATAADGPASLIADFRKIIPTAEAALEGRQIQPILL